MMQMNKSIVATAAIGDIVLALRTERAEGQFYRHRLVVAVRKWELEFSKKTLEYPTEGSKSALSFEEFKVEVENWTKDRCFIGERWSYPVLEALPKATKKEVFGVSWKFVTPTGITVKVWEFPSWEKTEFTAVGAGGQKYTAEATAAPPELGETDKKPLLEGARAEILIRSLYPPDGLKLAVNRQLALWRREFAAELAEEQRLIREADEKFLASQ